MKMTPRGNGSLLKGLRVGKRTNKAETKNHGKKTHPLFTWWIEITACVIGLISLLAMVVTLYPHQGKPLPEWPFGLSINTLLSIYSFVLKAAIPIAVSSCLCQLQWSWFSIERPLIDVVRYDSAAKGFLGSVQWLWAHHISQPLTALGALITIVSIIIDPFVQQLILYEDCVTALDLGVNASLPRTNGFIDGLIFDGPLDYALDPEFQSSIEVGLFGSPETVGAVCPTGNCTFPPQYTSLGYCSACQDISDLVGIAINATGPPEDGVTVNDNITSTLPSGLSTIWYGTLGETLSGTTVNSTEVQILQGATFLSEIGFDASTGQQVVGCDTAVENATLWHCRVANAASCKLQPCVRTYNASVTAGKLTEVMVDSSPIDQEWGSNENGVLKSIVDTQCTSAQENASLSQLGYDLKGRWISYNTTLGTNNITMNFSTNAEFPLSLYAHKCVYTMDYFFESTLWEYLDDLMDGNVTSGITEGMVMGEVMGLQSLQKLYNSSYTNLKLIEDAFQNISDSLTTQIRLNGIPSQSIPVTGQTLHYATCLNVHWPWISLPASVMMSTCVLLVLTMIKVHRDAMPSWKTTILPILFNGPELNTGTLLTTEKSMEEKAAKIKVVLHNVAGQGFELVETYI